MTQLVPCPTCHRHVRSGSSECPFCATTLPGAPTPRTFEVQRGMSRAAIIALGAAIASSTPFACSDETGEQTSEASGTGTGASGSGSGTGTGSGTGGEATGGSGSGGRATGGEAAGGEGGEAVGGQGVGGIGGEGGGIAPPYGAPPQGN